MMRKHPTLRQSIFVLSAVCAFGNDRKRVPLVSSLPRKKKISLVVSDFNRDTSVAIATSFHHRGKVVCFSIVLPSRAMMMMMMKEDDGTPGEERKNERKKLLKASFFSLLGGKRKEKEEDNQFFFGAKISSFF